MVCIISYKEQPDMLSGCPNPEEIKKAKTKEIR